MHYEQNKKKVLIPHAEAEASLAVIRSLGRKGVPIVATGNSVFAKGLWSKYVIQKIKSPSTEDPQVVVDWLIENAKNGVFDIFLPCGDDYALIASHYYDQLSKYMLIPISSKEIIDITLFKEKTYQKCKEYGIPCPETYIISSIDELDEISAKLNYPVIIKSRISFGISPKIKGIIIQNKSELLQKYMISKPTEYLSEYSNLGYSLIQEYIPGGMLNLYTVGVFIDKKSNPVAIFCGRKIRQYPKDAGSCCMAETSYEQEAIDTSIKLLQKIGFYGVAEVEIKKDDRSGEFKVIEINPRPYSWIWLAVESGIDLPYLWYNNTYLNGFDQEVVISNNDLGYVYCIKDFVWLISQLPKSANKINFLKKHLISLNRENTYGVWNKKDPFPFIMDIPSTINSLIHKLRK